MRYYAGLLAQTLMIISASVSAGNISSASLPNGYDLVETTGGARCQSAITPSAYVQMGVYGEDQRGVTRYFDQKPGEKTELGAYVQLVIPIGGPSKRIDCSRMYELELQALQAQIERLKKLNTLPSNVFE